VTITVLMLQTRRGDAGATLTAGQSYDLRDDLARELVGLGYAQDTYAVIDNTRDSLADISLLLSSTQLGKLNDAGTPIPKGTLLRDPVTGLIYGQSDGAGSYSAFGSDGSASVEVQVAFSGAGDKLIWVGPGRLMEVVLTTAATGSIELTDEPFAGSAVAAFQTISTTSGQLTPTTFNSGAGQVLYTGLTLAVTGATTGYVLMRGE
jgi:hypothetical protein